MNLYWDCMMDAAGWRFGWQAGNCAEDFAVQVCTNYYRQLLPPRYWRICPAGRKNRVNIFAKSQLLTWSVICWWKFGDCIQTFCCLLSFPDLPAFSDDGELLGYGGGGGAWLHGGDGSCKQPTSIWAAGWLEDPWLVLLSDDCWGLCWLLSIVTIPTLSFNRIWCPLMSWTNPALWSMLSWRVGFWMLLEHMMNCCADCGNWSFCCIKDWLSVIEALMISD